MSQPDIPAILERRVAPIDRLFVEILTYIFHMCVLEHGCFFTRLDVNDHKTGPWKLGHVCSMWRQIANNTPTLWTRLSFSFSRLVRDPVSRFKIALERSSGLSLNLELSPDDRYPIDVQRNIYQLAISHSWRWEHLTITPNHAVLPFLSDIHGRQLDKLSRLVVHCPELWTSLHIDAFQDAPALQIVELHHNYAGVQFELPWNNIIEFFDYKCSGDSESIHHVIDMIQRCPNIQTFHVPMMCYPPSTAVSLPTPFVRTSLRDLTACEGPILRSLILPQLEKICLTPGEDSQEGCPDDALPALLSLIQCSQCLLPSLELSHVTFTDVLLEILHCTPHLENLRIYTECWEPDYNRIFKSLIGRLALYPVPQRSFLPLLSNINITVADLVTEEPCRFVDHVFFDMVCLRWNVGVLAAIRLDISQSGEDLMWGLTQEHISEFRKFKEDGLDIKLGILRRDDEARVLSSIRTRYV